MRGRRAERWPVLCRPFHIHRAGREPASGRLAVRKDLLSSPEPLSDGPPATRDEPRLAQKVLHSFAWQGGSQIVAQTLSWAGTLVVIRLLSPADYGLMAMVLVFMNFLFMVAELGVGGATIQARTLDLDTYRRLFGVIITSNLLGMAIGFGGAPILAAVFEEPRLVPLARVLSLNFLLTTLTALPQADAIRRLDFRVKGKVDILAAVAGTGTSLLMALRGFGVWSLVGGMLAQNLCRVSYTT